MFEIRSQMAFLNVTPNYRTRNRNVGQRYDERKPEFSKNASRTYRKLSKAIESLRGLIRQWTDTFILLQPHVICSRSLLT